jgi:hypothetical protein
MPHLTHKLAVMLLTFTLGVVAATLWLSLGSRNSLGEFTGPTLLSNAADPPANWRWGGVCEEWVRANPVNEGLGWDLTYVSLLTSSGVCPGELYCQFAAEKPQPPVNKLFAEWQGDPIVSSMLIELPDGHADMMAAWLIRTKEHAYWWGFHPHRPNPQGKQPIPTEDYDRAFETMACWRQDEPSNRRLFDGRGDGYLGFLSIYKEGKSRQMLLSSRDIFLSWPNGSEVPDEATWGRLLKTLKPLYLTAMRQQKQAAQDHK